MYGYIRQPDGVLKPIQLNGIKNIFREGNSINIVYFQVGSTPLEIPRVDQGYYYMNQVVKTCVDDPSAPGNFKTDLYTLSSTDFVNGDVKISFGNTHLDILEVFTKWMNSILSGVVHATSDVTLNDYSPSLKVGYVFSAESSLPTVLAYRVPEGDDPCETVPTIQGSEECVVASDLTINATPPVHTSIFKTIWNETDKTLNLEPLLDGQYILWQWIAAEQCEDPLEFSCQQPCASEGGASPPTYRNAIASDPGQVLTTVFGGAINGYTICEANIQQIFTSDRTSYTPDPLSPNDPGAGTPVANPTGGMAYAIQDPGCCGYLTGGVWPTASAPDIQGVALNVGNIYNSSDFRIRQTGSVTWPNANNLNGAQISGTESEIGTRFCDQVDTNVYAQEIVIPSIISTNGQDNNPSETDYNTKPIINPTFGKSSVYPFSIGLAVHGGTPDTIVPQIGISGINMNVLTIEAGTYTLANGNPNPEFLIMNGVPTCYESAEGGLYRLDESLSQSKLAGTTNPDSTYVGDTNPIFWKDGAPDSNLSGGNAWITIKGINMRPLWRIGGSTWQQAFRESFGPQFSGTNTHTKLVEAGIIPQGEAGFGAISELVSNNLRMWQRSIATNPKGEVTTTDWTLYSPATTTASGLLPLMTNDTYQETGGPPPWDDRNTATDVVTIPILIPETDPKLLAAGFTHRAFGAGSMNDTTTDWSQGPQDSTEENEFRIRGVGMRQSMNPPYSWQVAPIIQPNQTGNCS